MIAVSSPGALGGAPVQRMCRCCGAAEVETFHEVPAVPVHNSLLLDTAEAAGAVRTGDLELGCCPGCGFIQNVRFDPELVAYSQDYEDTQAHSPRFVEFATSLAQRFAERYGIRHADVLEIGCGKGDFLRLVCDATESSGIGYDPAVGPGAMQGSDVRLVAELYDESVHPTTDLVLCRHTLEHIPDVARFVRMVRSTLLPAQPITYLEVPDTLRILEELAFWDLYYEHCSYFTGTTLDWLLGDAGFEVVSSELGFDDQYLMVEARPVGGTPSWAVDRAALADHAATVAAAAARFAAGVDELRDRWHRTIVGWHEQGRSIAIWGGGSKAVGLLATAQAAHAIHAVVDINPRKHGRFLPGSALEVVAPEQLVVNGIDVVVIMNPIYLDEISDTLGGLGLDPELVTA